MMQDPYFYGTHSVPTWLCVVKGWQSQDPHTVAPSSSCPASIRPWLPISPSTWRVSQLDVRLPTPRVSVLEGHPTAVSEAPSFSRVFSQNHSSLLQPLAIPSVSQHLSSAAKANADVGARVELRVKGKGSNHRTQSECSFSCSCCIVIYLNFHLA